MYLNIFFLPLIGSCLSGLFGRFLGPFGAGIVTISCVVSSLFISFFAFDKARSFQDSIIFIRLLLIPTIGYFLFFNTKINLPFCFF